MGLLDDMFFDKRLQPGQMPIPPAAPPMPPPQMPTPAAAPPMPTPTPGGGGPPGMGDIGKSLGGMAKALGGGGGAPPPPVAEPPQIMPSRAGPETMQQNAQAQAQAQPMMQGLLKAQPLVDPRRRSLV